MELKRLEPFHEESLQSERESGRQVEEVELVRGKSRIRRRREVEKQEGREEKKRREKREKGCTVVKPLVLLGNLNYTAEVLCVNQSTKTLSR